MSPGERLISLPELVEVVVFAYDEGARLAQVATALRAQRIQHAFHTLLVVGGSDDTLEVAFQLQQNAPAQYTVVRQRPGDGKAGAILRAMGTTSADVVVFLDGDTVVSDDWLQELVRTLEEEKLDVCTGENQLPLVQRTASFYHFMSRALCRGNGKDTLPRPSRGVALNRKAISSLPFHTLRGRPGTADDVWLGIMSSKVGLRRGVAPKAIARTPLPGDLVHLLKSLIVWKARAVYTERWTGEQWVVALLREILLGGLVFLLPALPVVLLLLISLSNETLPIGGLFLLGFAAMVYVRLHSSYARLQRARYEFTPKWRYHTLLFDWLFHTSSFLGRLLAPFSDFLASRYQGSKLDRSDSSSLELKIRSD